MTKKNVIAALEKIGVTDKEKQAEFFRALKDSAIMDQEIDLDELEAVAGGDCSLRDQEADQKRCVKDHERWYYRDGCAATVEVQELAFGQLSSQGTCSNNDNCHTWAVVYNMQE